MITWSHAAVIKFRPRDWIKYFSNFNHGNPHDDHWQIIWRIPTNQKARIDCGRLLFEYIGFICYIIGNIVRFAKIFNVNNFWYSKCKSDCMHFWRSSCKRNTFPNYHCIPRIPCGLLIKIMHRFSQQRYTWKSAKRGL